MKWVLKFEFKWNSLLLGEAQRPAYWLQGRNHSPTDGTSEHESGVFGSCCSSGRRFWKPSLSDTKEPMKLFLVHTMLSVEFIWKNKSGWLLLVLWGMETHQLKISGCMDVFRWNQYCVLVNSWSGFGLGSSDLLQKSRSWRLEHLFTWSWDPGYWKGICSIGA